LLNAPARQCPACNASLQAGRQALAGGAFGDSPIKDMSEIINAIKQICNEKSLSYESVIQTIESALAAAYRKDFGGKNQNIKVEFDPETAKSKVFDVKTVVENMPEIEEEGEKEEVKDKEEKKEKRQVKKEKKEKEKKEKEKGKTEGGDKAEDEGEEEERKFNPKTEIQIDDAKLIKKTVKIGEELKMKLPIPDAYGRMAAQTAKQVIIQKLREAERDMIFNEFKEKENEVIAGVVQRREGRVVLVDLGKAVGLLLSNEQIQGERYNPGDRIKVFVKEVSPASKGVEIILSRTSEEILKKIFYLEIPEISNGLVEIKAVAREAGSRSKVAVLAVSETVDPIGSCVGQRGARIQTIISELGGEKIDIIEYNEDPSKFISNALAPAKVISVEVDKKEKRALIKVAEDQLSLAIGKDGQNVRLAARLTGWRMDITGEKSKKVAAEDDKDMAESKQDKSDKKAEEKDKEITKEKKETKEDKEKKDKKSKKKETKEDNNK